MEQAEILWRDADVRWKGPVTGAYYKIIGDYLPSHAPFFLVVNQESVDEDSSDSCGSEADEVP